MTTPNKLYLSVMAYIVLGGLILNFGFVPVVVIGGPLVCWYLVWRNTRNFGGRYSHKAAVYNQETDMPFIRKLFNLEKMK